jgi:anti-anti-sigma regulatory factor
MSESLSLSVDSLAGIPVVRVRGPLVYGQDLSALTDIVARVKNEGRDRLVLDLTGAEATDSSGISALLEVRHIIGANLILLGPSARLRSSLAVTRVTSMFEIVEDEPEVLRRLGES